ncbi:MULTISPECIES: hypothetical protein [Xanthomonas]|uniref:hypothetical protein n=1 Tax=Xanthomonas TaxID=338 RepID=UPI001290671D|nr:MULTISPECIES: hypothetical protein [Xanthomonas]
MDLLEPERTPSLLSRLRSGWKGLRPTAKGYAAAVIVFAVGIAAAWKAPKSDLADGSANLALALFGLCFLKEAYDWVVPKLQLPLVKLLVASGGVMAAAAAWRLTRQQDKTRQRSPPLWPFWSRCPLCPSLRH